MTQQEIISIQPGELRFPFELRKLISTTLHLTNTTSQHVAFKVKTTSPKKYSVRPNAGVIAPGAPTDVVVTMQAQKEMPPDLQCKDKFLVQSVLVPAGSTDFSDDYFNKENGHVIHEVKLRVVYLAPQQPPSPVAESSEEGVAHPSPFPSSAGAKGLLTPTDPAQKDLFELRTKLTEAQNSLSLVTEERNKLKSELAKGGAAGSSGAGVAVDRRASGWSTLVLLLTALLFLCVGFYLGKGKALGQAGGGQEL